MGTVEATRSRKKAVKGSAARRTRTAPKPSAAQLRDLLDRALAAVDADDEAGSLLRATGLRARLRVPDLGVSLDVAPSEEGDHHVSWTFSDVARPGAEAGADHGLPGRQRIPPGT